LLDGLVTKVLKGRPSQVLLALVVGLEEKVLKVPLESLDPQVLKVLMALKDPQVLPAQPERMGQTDLQDLQAPTSLELQDRKEQPVLKVLKVLKVFQADLSLDPAVGLEDKVLLALTDLLAMTETLVKQVLLAVTLKVREVPPAMLVPQVTLDWMAEMDGMVYPGNRVLEVQVAMVLMVLKVLVDPLALLVKMA